MGQWRAERRQPGRRDLGRRARLEHCDQAPNVHPRGQGRETKKKGKAKEEEEEEEAEAEEEEEVEEERKKTTTTRKKKKTTRKKKKKKKQKKKKKKTTEMLLTSCPFLNSFVVGSSGEQLARGHQPGADSGAAPDCAPRGCRAASRLVAQRKDGARQGVYE